jgi:hypothetical protein
MDRLSSSNPGLPTVIASGAKQSRATRTDSRLGSGLPRRYAPRNDKEFSTTMP